MESKKFHVIIFGASGYIGRFAILKAIAKLDKFKWAIAGRDMRKLKCILNWASEQADVNLCHIPIFVANAKDRESLKNVTKKCQVFINCCGPPQLYNETILNCCIQSGTHYVDVSNDPYFNELMQLRYHNLAVENNTYVISSCGYHSFPTEIGLNILQENFNGTINYVDAFVQYESSKPEFKFGPLASSTFWKTLIMGCAVLGDLPLIRKDIRTTALPTFLPKQPIKPLIDKLESTSKTCIRFPLIDQQTVERSQFSMYVLEKQRPLQFYKYLVFPSKLMAILFIVWTLIISFCAQFQKTRCFIIKYMRFFSLGLCSDCGPNEELMENFHFKIDLHATGWSQPIKADEVSLLSESSQDRTMSLSITGTNPFYAVASFCLILSALLILEEQNAMPNNGGVYSPAVAFKKTSIHDKLATYNDVLNIEFCE